MFCLPKVGHVIILEHCFFQISSYLRAYICRRNLQNTKNEIPLETFDQEENKTFKLKRSKKASRLNNIWTNLLDPGWASQITSKESPTATIWTIFKRKLLWSPVFLSSTATTASLGIICSFIWKLVTAQFKSAHEAFLWIAEGGEREGRGRGVGGAR